MNYSTTTNSKPKCKKYFISYDEKAKVNYIYILCFYLLAEFDNQTKCYSKVNICSYKIFIERVKELLNVDISESTLKRILNDKAYNEYFNYNKKEKVINLNNNIKSKNKFIVLSNLEITFLLNKKDNLLIKYYFYLKFYCGFSKNKKTDNTAKQILIALGYSDNSNSYISKLYNYN